MWLNQQLKLRHSTVDFVSKQTEILTKTQKGLKIKNGMMKNLNVGLKP